MKLASLLFAAAIAALVACGQGAAAPATPEPALDTMLHADGQPCESSAQCASGACEGTCDEGGGVCASRDRACTADLVQYCGCDGETFAGSGSCPGHRLAAREPCPS
jgi:hypothetical protein